MGEIVDFSKDKKTGSGFQKIRERLEKQQVGVMSTEEEYFKTKPKLSTSGRWEIIVETAEYRKLRNKITGEEKLLYKMGYQAFVVKAIDLESNAQVSFAAGEQGVPVRGFIPAKSLQEVRIFKDSRAVKHVIKDWNNRQSYAKYKFSLETYEVAKEFFGLKAEQTSEDVALNNPFYNPEWEPIHEFLRKLDDIGVWENDSLNRIRPGNFRTIKTQLQTLEEVTGYSEDFLVKRITSLDKLEKAFRLVTSKGVNFIPFLDSSVRAECFEDIVSLIHNGSSIEEAVDFYRGK